MSTPTGDCSEAEGTLLGDAPCSALDLALMAYEVANFREYDREKALYRYRNHTDTNRAVKLIAQLFAGSNRELLIDVWETLIEVQSEIGTKGSLANQISGDIKNIETILRQNK